MDLFRVNHPVSSRFTYIAGTVGIGLLVAAYLGVAYYRHAQNPTDQMTPTPGQIFGAFQTALTADEFTGEVPLVADVLASLKLLLSGFTLSVLASLVVGLHAGALPWLNSLLDPVLKLVSYIPTIALLFLIFVTLGYDDAAKIFLIFFATFIPLTRSLILHVRSVPERQVWKAQTCGASEGEVVWITLRRTTEPKFLDDIRLQLGGAWIYLIIAELINAPAGLGYRINVASRNLNVSMIMVYVLVISLLAFVMDRGIQLLSRHRNRWAY